MQLYERGNKYHAVGYYWDPKSGRRRRWRKSTGIEVDGTKRTRQIAEHTAQQIAQSLATGGGRRSRSCTVKAAIEILIRDLERAARSQKTIDIVNEKAMHLFRLIGPDFDCGELTNAQLCEYADVRLKEVARPWEIERCVEHGKKRKRCADTCVTIPRKTVERGTVERELRTLREALGVAKRLKKFEGEIPEMPNLGEVYVPKERWLPKSESRQLILALPLHWRDHFVMWRQLGIDEGELYTIERRDLMWASREVRVRGTKNKYRDRLLPMTGEVEELLRRRSKGTGALFETWTNALRDIKAACRRVRIAPCCIKDLRRSFATELAIAGAPILLVSKLMGHRGTRMLEEVYARVGTGQHMHDVMRSVSTMRATSPGELRAVATVCQTQADQRTQWTQTAGAEPC